MTEKYLPPRKQELKELGYIRRFVTYEATDAIIANLTAPNNKLSFLAVSYINQYKTIVNLVRHPIAVYAYGINNLSQFGNNLDNVLYQCSIILYRSLIKHYNTTSDNPPYKGKIPSSLIKSMSDTFYNYAHQEASILATEIRNKSLPYDSSNGWYSKLLAKKNDTKK